MNKVMLIGRLTRDPDVRYEPDGTISYARYSIAVDRRVKKEEGQQADFFFCVAFGRQAEFTEKYLKKGMKMAVCGRLQSASYTNRQGQKVYETSIIVEEQEFAESKKEASAVQNTENFMDFVPSEDGLPFN